MPAPSASRGTVTGTFEDPSGQPAAGTVTFVPSPAQIFARQDDVIILPVSVAVQLNTSGHFSASLLATDDPDLEPAGWTWTVTVAITGLKPWTFSIEVPADGTVDLTDAAPVPSSLGIHSVVGPQGPIGPIGPQGPQGIQGIQGEVGPQGYPGVPTPTALYLPGVIGNGVSTPDAAEFTPTPSLSLRAAIAPVSWGAAGNRMVIAKSGNAAPNFEYQFYLRGTDGLLSFVASADGSAFITKAATAPTGFANGTLHAIRLDWSNTGTVTFLTKDTTPASAAGDLLVEPGWSQLGAVVSGAPTSIFNGTNPVMIGQRSNGADLPFDGRIYAVAVYVDGALQGDISFTSPIPNRWRDQAGHIWTPAGDQYSWAMAV